MEFNKTLKVYNPLIFRMEDGYHNSDIKTPEKAVIWSVLQIST